MSPIETTLQNPAPAGRVSLAGIDLFWLRLHQRALPEPSSTWLNDFLEQPIVDKMRLPKRRADWLLGRYTAKRLLESLALPELADCELQTLVVRAASDGAPMICRGANPLGFPITISHSGGYALVVICLDSGLQIGCDLEQIEARSDRFVADYFTASERDLVLECEQALRPLLANLIWSAKESALKALRVGLRRDTRSVEIRPGPLNGDRTGWSPLQVLDRERGRWMSGLWRTTERQVFTLAADRL